MCIYIYICIYIHIYITRKTRILCAGGEAKVAKYDVCIYIYIYVCIYKMHMCIYTYIYRERERKRDPVAQSAEGSARMQEVSGSNPRLGGLGISPLQAFGGRGTLQSSASGLQRTTQGIPSRPKITVRVKTKHVLALRLCTPSRCSPFI